MKALQFAVLALIAGLFLAGCSSSSNNGAPPDAQARFVHVSPFTGPVSVAVDGNVVLPSLDYHTVTPYLTIGPGLHTVTFTPVGGGPVAATLPIPLASLSKIPQLLERAAVGADQLAVLERDALQAVRGIRDIAVRDGVDP